MRGRWDSWAARHVGGLWGAGQRLRSGAFAPDFPVVIFVAACGGCLQIPSGLSTPRAPQATNAPGSISCNLTAAGASGFLWLRIDCGEVMEDLAEPAPCRPRGRPRGAYTASCVVIMPLRVWRASIVIFCRIGGLHSGLPANADACRAPSVAPPPPCAGEATKDPISTSAQATTATTNQQRVCRLRAARAAAVGGQRKSRH
ncbi:hypothetical protein LMG3431_04795 [Achromobacter pestifer]|uniref:Uncharacterized protein n=1 Tax=Achromobacter pestifer TaxID=1353889 RepID=A0A6S7AY13_9BURK|nr:hypothetical protein LMG3431_04795 [Achromobacter pestifer]